MRTQDQQHVTQQYIPYGGKEDQSNISSVMPPPKVNTLNMKAQSFLESHKQENLPTPKKSAEFDSMFIEIINDSDRFFQFENYLEQECNYDLDILEFYIKVMDFKKETGDEQRCLAGGVIIDSFLSEEAEFYIADAICGDGDSVKLLISQYEQYL